MELEARGTRTPRGGGWARIGIVLTMAWLAVTLAALPGCPGGGGNPDGGDGGAPPADPCNSRDEALTKPECEIKLNGDFLSDYVGTPGDQDYFRIQMPAGLTARSLVHVFGGYEVPATAVNLSVNVLTEDGMTSLARGIDRHGAGAPRPVDLVFPYSQSNTKLVVLVGDEAANPARPNYDYRAAYRLKAELLTDPDQNEPNNTSANATNIPLMASGSVLAGTTTGQLSTTDDVDYFAITVPAPAGPRKLLYVRITAPELSPPPPYRISYTLYRPDGTALSEGTVLNEFIAVNLATSRLAPPGRYTLAVQQYHNPIRPGPVAGDLRTEARYTIEVKVLDELDTNEGNDTLAQAKLTALPAPDGVRRSYTGRMDHVADRDWFAFDLPAQSAPTLLHYWMRPTTTGGRFEPLPLPEGSFKERQLLVFTTNATTADCQTKPNLCPRDVEGRTDLIPELDGYCAQSPPQCLRSRRTELPDVTPFDRLANLKNFEGVLQVLPASTTTRYYVAIQDRHDAYADDFDYTLELQWSADPDETSRFSGGREQVTIAGLVVDSTAATFPTPPGTATSLPGTLSFGYGRTTNFKPNLGIGPTVRGPDDYDAVVSDVDQFELTIPSSDPWTGSGYDDRTWELQWSVNHYDGGYVHDLKMQLLFCDGDVMPTDGGSCSVVSTTDQGSPLFLAYTPDPVAVWHDASRSQPLYDRDVTPAAETVLARAFGCFCFEPRFRRGGKFFLNIMADDRASYAPVSYQVKTALTSYPKSYAGLSDGGAKSCPAPMRPAPPDGGADGGTDAGTGGPVDAGYLPGCFFTNE